MTLPRTRHYLNYLEEYRRQLSVRVHRGPCQSLTASCLQLSWLEGLDGEERKLAERELAEFLRQASQDLRQLYCQALADPSSLAGLAESRWPLDWERLWTCSVFRRISLEFIACALLLEDQPQFLEYRKGLLLESLPTRPPLLVALSRWIRPLPGLRLRPCSQGWFLQPKPGP